MGGERRRKAVLTIFSIVFSFFPVYGGGYGYPMGMYGGYGGGYRTPYMHRGGMYPSMYYGGGYGGYGGGYYGMPYGGGYYGGYYHRPGFFRNMYNRLRHGSSYGGYYPGTPYGGGYYSPYDVDYSTTKTIWKRNLGY
ncbi:hypothetical protein BC940DRAFT_302167, partial [Gongronella butleri]